jgi:hypothetical protein
LPEKAINGKDILFNVVIRNPAYVSFVIDSNYRTNPVVLHPGVNIVQARLFQNKYQLIRRDKYLEENAMEPIIIFLLITMTSINTLEITS